MPVQLPTVSPRWATDGGVTLEPSLSEKEAGWAQGQRPPARWQNWWQNNAYAHIDILHDALLKDWREGSFVDGSGAVNSKIGYHKGWFYVIVGTDLYRSRDGKAWGLVNGALPITSNGIIASDDSRMVYGEAGGGRYSNDDGASWAATLGVAVADMFPGYMEQAALWLGSTGAGAGVQSADGITWAANGSTVVGSLIDFAENLDGSILVHGDQYSVNQGGAWAATINAPGAFTGGIIFSALRGDFIGAYQTGGNTELYDTSATGTWESVAFSTLTNILVFSMFEMRGHLYAVGVDSTIAGTAAVLMVSRDSGVTWEYAATLTGAGIARTMHFAGDTLDRGYAIIGSQAGLGVSTPQYAGLLTP